MTQLVKALIVEENAVMRETIAWLLSRVEGINAVSQLSDGGKLVECMENEKPNIVLLDAGIAYRENERLHDIQQANKELRIFVLTENDEELFEQTDVAAKIRFDGMINKEDVFEKIKGFMG